MGKSNNVCAMPGCRNVKSLSAFHFPKDKDRCEIWKAFTGRADLYDKTPIYCNSNLNLCAEHFDNSQFMNFQKKRLIWSAVPTIIRAVSEPSNVEATGNDQSKNKHTGNKIEQCAILQCKEIHNNSSLTTFPFPKDRARCNLWKAFVGRDDVNDKSTQLCNATLRLCAAHFEASQFVTKLKLISNAVPTIKCIRPQTSKLYGNFTKNQTSLKDDPREPILTSSEKRNGVSPLSTFPAKRKKREPSSEDMVCFLVNEYLLDNQCLQASKQLCAKNKSKLMKLKDIYATNPKPPSLMEIYNFYKKHSACTMLVDEIKSESIYYPFVGDGSDIKASIATFPDTTLKVT